MNKSRIEAFSDGVMAIIITIMVLEIKAPEHSDLASLLPLIPVCLSYVLSFIYVGIYWNNHHHMFQVVKKIDGSVLWYNTALLFWLSLIPFATSWMGEQSFATVPIACYGFILLMCAISYIMLQNKIIKLEGKESVLHQAVNSDKKGKISMVCYVSAIPLAFVSPIISGILYIFVALIWIIPDRRIENQINKL
ncbi:putative membrane protein [Flavobacterium sp. 1]|uniref:TMEM175 family protein n=1 Tax=Flavobacterium sp. 1 TaxID=2035200 RepID=UPI000C243F13|nr:TMEM175 family protein [Flavobacterium sp. 1]PJJ07248.1 putative membrane protein [Flavobacterium sp. 1]